ncbi:MAG: DUF551 domain-containing protein [Lachnospiraceae bacterium]|nr:DUF551 domain-containing protein [Lachnospiraceae bacterium]
MDWIKVSDQMPPEHDSVFMKYKVTSYARRLMYEKCSDDVFVTIEDIMDGSRRVDIMQTRDGKWFWPSGKQDKEIISKIIAWMPFPEPYKGAEDE